MIKKTMPDKKLIIEYNEWVDGEKGLTHLVGNSNDETLYAEYISKNNDGMEYDTIELAVNINQMIIIRDYLTKLINRTGKAYRNYPEEYCILEDYNSDIIGIKNLEGK